MSSAVCGSKWPGNVKFRKNTLVLAGDNQMYLRYLAIALKRMGFEVLPAENGREAINLAKIFVISAAILDLKTPVTDGIETLRMIRQDSQTSTMPVIMISAQAKREEIKECTRLGCAEMLTKPVSLDTLHEVLQKNIFPPGGTQRKHFRVLWNREVTIAVRDKSHRLYAENLSERGLYVRKKEPLPVGTVVDVSFPLRGGERFTLKGSVIYARVGIDDIYRIPPGMGIEFKDLTGDDAVTLKDYIAELLDKESAVAPQEKKITQKCFP